MSSYASRIISFFLFFYTLFTPSTTINASAEDNIKPEKLYTHLKKTNDTSEPDIPHVIGSNIQRVSHILSSSPSELVEQATSYALGKFNSALSSETQKWLSQFGTARINFGLDRKWTLKNNSLDILLPLYDNKADWLLFSQLGYRNKESRNTINLGLGGRYFYHNWMYGLNTFYDHDLTGKNQRLGLGGEIWGDYIKLSANAYYRLSDWQKSRNFQDYHERPATGYDINGEFFLPVYPNLGIKLAYEQYFGDNVTLFNRDTKQKNPNLAKLGVTYTPIPLFTMSVDYKQGESGHTETQFLANLNYKFGVPLSTQLLPTNVASMRQLTGSRYDLVERNNNIILDHQKIEKEELIAIEPIIGYSHQEITVNAPVPPHVEIKKINWVITDEAFKKNKGKISSDSGKSTVITLPSYQETHKDGYTLDISIKFITGGQEKTKSIHIPVKVLPFMVDGEVKITPPASPEPTGKKENGYTFNAPIITYEGSPSGKFVKNAVIENVSWITEPALGNESGLKFELWNHKSARTNEKGELTDEKGQLMPNVLTSTKPHENVVVYIQLDGAPKQEIGSVTFGKNGHQVKINFDISSVEVTNLNKDKPLLGDGQREYYYKALIVEKDKKGKHSTRQTLKNVQWTHDHGGIDEKKLPQPEPYSPTGGDKFKPDENGYLYAKLKSSVGVKDVKVTLTIPRSSSDDTKDFVSKNADKNVDFTPITQNAVLYVYNTYTDKHKYFDNRGGKRHPHNIFDTLRGELRASTSSGAFNQNEVTYGITDVNAPIYGDGMLSFGAGNRGPIQFQSTGSATITATINKPSGEIQFYEYKMFATKLIIDSDDGYKDVTENITCRATPGNIEPHLFLDKEASDFYNIYSLHSEFGNLYNWGILGHKPGMDKNKATIVVENTNPAIRDKYRIYDFKNNTFDEESKGIVLCYTTTIK
ncbi:inverse autotransporter beta domain-containing protein [Xenorhabdus cabanillasii]|uniref:Inverse autotransporter beta-domain domain-containing protein n=1 Tax=Xenorhabdus cabanillasii JM26 TaxID=1427517 RepID=W1ILU1_9GAMM|nr:inverse autotransporter beta domain-containing protein [Xenorhabdus cabanillasii]PHM78143.1 invasin [Xenorhabdus cabanillasii JM26]CDL79452.1 exported hypothetical protein [Xenorhabdus cabanillasii JM26]